MLHEMSQIIRFVAKKYGLETKGEGFNVGIVGDPSIVPDGDHIIPLGESETPYQVSIRKGKIIIGPPMVVAAEPRKSAKKADSTKPCEHIEDLIRTIKASTVNIDADLRWAYNTSSAVLLFTCKCGSKYEPEGSVGPR